MPEKSLQIRNLYPIVGLTTVLLLISIFLSYKNSQVIQATRKISEEAEQVAVNTNNIIRYLHLSDIGLRGYALVQENPQIRGASDTAKLEIQKTMQALGESLTLQEFPRMDDFFNFKQAVEDYFSYVDSMFLAIDESRTDVFIARLAEDPGYALYLKHVVFAKAVNQFEDAVIDRADKKYQQALRNAYLIQIIIFILGAPLLFIGAYQTSTVFGISERLRKSEIERRNLLAEQNVQLEKMVYERTKEIQAQNEEIQAQNEEITLHNEQLELQRREIESKNHLIERANEELNVEVKRQTIDLRNANDELVEHNNRLKQFSYIVSHNLRSPVARLLGLSSLLNSSDGEERERILELMTNSTHELDQIIRDINLILEIDKLNTQALNRIDIREYLSRVTDLIKPELESTGSSLDVQLAGVLTVPFLGPYMESILYNLISNAIKYRDPEKKLKIVVRGAVESEFTKLEISDNGLGIDLARFEKDLFKLYKRFHTHVEGKGLGLYLVKSQLQALGGKLNMESQVGVGTTFYIYFKNSIDK